MYTYIHTYIYIYVYICIYIGGGGTCELLAGINLPETKNWPSGEKAAHSAWHFLPNLITGPGAVTYL